VLASMNTILHERRLAEHYCTLCYASIDQKRRLMTMANSGLPYPVLCNADGCRLEELAGLPLGFFEGSTYEELEIPLRKGDLWVFATDGIVDAHDRKGFEFGTERFMELVERHRDSTAQQLVDGIFEAVQEFQGRARTHDDMTVVAMRVTE
jgi:sigma-B regulation protein RsbU (phosphoserine phosphatase)